MRRLHTFFLWLWRVVVLAVLLGVAINWLFGPPRPEVVAFFQAHWRGLSLAFLVLGGVTLLSWRDHTRHDRSERERRLRAHFALCKPASAVRPEDLGFYVSLQCGGLDSQARPHYAAYIPRQAVRYDQLSAKASQHLYAETDLMDDLQQNISFVLLGQPMEGKTRTLYEIIRRLPGYDVVRPANTSSIPPDDAFAVLKNRRVILLLDDLNNYAGGELNLLTFRDKLRDQAKAWAIAATCRDGSELGVVVKALAGGLHRFYEEIPLKLALLPLTADNKAQLAQD